MSSTEDVLAAGDIDFTQLIDIVKPMITGNPIRTDYGYTYDDGIWTITDCTLMDDWYVDDQGLPLSQYRFCVSTEGPQRVQLAKQAFDKLSAQTNLDLLWMSDMEILRDRRPALVAA